MICGLIAIGLIWAPRNHLDVVFFFGILFSGAAEISVLVFAGFYLGLQFLAGPGWGVMAALGDGSVLAAVSSAALHALGAAAGAAVGFAMLKKGWVDCERWDILSVWKDDRRGART